MLGCNGYMKATTTLICVGISIANPKKLVFTILHTHMIQWKHSKQIQCNQHNKFHSDVLQKHKYDNIIILKIEFLVQGLVDMFKIWDDILYLTFMLIVIQWTILHCPSFKLLKKFFSNVSTLNYIFSKPQYSICLRNPIWRAASNICTGTMVPDCMSSKKMIFYLTNFHLICHPAWNTIHFVSTSIEGLKYVIVSTFLYLKSDLIDA